jgi:hypothetical protein
MFAGLDVDGTTLKTFDDDTAVTLTFATDTKYRCSACGADLAETPGGFDDDNGDRDCPAYQPDDPDADVTGPHLPERVALSWCNSAAIDTDEADDAITLRLSTGDPRGAFTITIRRVPDDANSPLAGLLLMHTPYPGQPMPHEPVHPLHPGTFVIGQPGPARLRLVAA